MKHGIKLRKLQRTPSHRWALLRNLVSALLHHETIKTTLPKAKEAARMAEKIITLGKRNTDPARRTAMAYLMPSHHYSPASFDSKTPPLKPLDYPTASSSTSSTTESDPETFEPPTTLLPKLFETLSARYSTRPGGYTRITKFGRRPGDNAPVAILSLVDGPRDLRFEMTARATARERAMGEERELTGRNRERVLKFRDEAGVAEFERKAEEFEASIRAEERALDGHRRRVQDTGKHHDELARMGKPFVGRRYQAGEKLPGMVPTLTGLGLARGDLGRRSRGEVRDLTPRYIGEKGDGGDRLSID